MDINVKVRIEYPELAAAIFAVADVLGQMKERNYASEKQGQTVEVKQEEVKAIALEEVRAKLASLSKAGKSEQVRALIKSYGGSKLTEVAPEKYEVLLREAAAI